MVGSTSVARRIGRIGRTGRVGGTERVGRIGGAEPAGAPGARRAAATCGICGSDEIGTDEVFDRGLWRLSECGRCAHRWTEGPFGPPPRRVPVRRARRPGLGAAVA